MSIATTLQDGPGLGLGSVCQANMAGAAPQQLLIYSLWARIGILRGNGGLGYWNLGVTVGGWGYWGLGYWGSLDTGG